MATVSLTRSIIQEEEGEEKNYLSMWMQVREGEKNVMKVSCRFTARDESKMKHPVKGKQTIEQAVP